MEMQLAIKAKLMPFKKKRKKKREQSQACTMPCRHLGNALTYQDTTLKQSARTENICGPCNSTCYATTHIILPPPQDIKRTRNLRFKL
jgi:hypothetical protein